jgi:branched-chain amino acid transport system substrate-binding protein
MGLLTSKSGPGAVFAVACENLAAMAVDELNADGGLYGRRVRLLIADDATDPAVGASEARWLIRAGCRVVLASVTSATFGAVQHEVGDSGVPLVHTLLNEGGGGPGHVFRWGERPADQLAVAAVPLMRTSGARTGSWLATTTPGRRGPSRGQAGAAAGARPGRRGCFVARDQGFRAGHRRDHALRRGSRTVDPGGVGQVAFERQCLAMGLRARCRTLSLVLDESTRERIGDSAAAGL